MGTKDSAIVDKLSHFRQQDLEGLLRQNEDLSHDSNGRHHKVTYNDQDKD